MGRWAALRLPAFRFSCQYTTEEVFLHTWNGISCRKLKSGFALVSHDMDSHEHLTSCRPHIFSWHSSQRVSRIVLYCWNECSRSPNSVDGLWRFDLELGGKSSGFDIEADDPDMSGPLDDLIHLNALRRGATSIGSGRVTLTTRAVSSGTSCKVPAVANEDMDGEPDGCERLEKMVGGRPRVKVSCSISFWRVSWVLSSANSSFFAVNAVDSSSTCSRVSRSSAISRCKASR
jgi:hypothetical protein